MTYDPFKTQVRAAVEHLLKASTTLGSRSCVEALEMAEFYIDKARRDAETNAERDLLRHLAEAGVSISQRNAAVLDLFLDALKRDEPKETTP